MMTTEEWRRHQEWAATPLGKLFYRFEATLGRSLDHRFPRATAISTASYATRIGTQQTKPEQNSCFF